MTTADDHPADDHRAYVAELRDPYLGWVWVVCCPFDGPFGRFNSKAEAQRAAKAHGAAKGRAR